MAKSKKKPAAVEREDETLLASGNKYFIELFNPVGVSKDLHHIAIVRRQDGNVKSLPADAEEDVRYFLEDCPADEVAEYFIARIEKPWAGYYSAFHAQTAYLEASPWYPPVSDDQVEYSQAALERFREVFPMQEGGAS